MPLSGGSHSPDRRHPTEEHLALSQFKFNSDCLSLTLECLRTCQVAANLLTDDVLMRSYQLTPEYRPLVDLHSELAPTQGNKGWFFGYSDALLGSTATFRPFKYEAHGNGQLQDGRWMVREVRLPTPMY